MPTSACERASEGTSAGLGGRTTVIEFAHARCARASPRRPRSVATADPSQVPCRTPWVGSHAMATQSLYRRYRPRRFSEVKGQEHVVRGAAQRRRSTAARARPTCSPVRVAPARPPRRASSPRCSTARTRVDGEPCCECDSCLAVERGTSYDVHELDAASNNGVDAMRDLIEKASLGTPGPAQGVHPRRGAHALQGGRGGAAEDARGAAAARRVRARHHRSAEGQRHHPQPHAAPAVPPAADGRARASTSAGWPPTPGIEVDRRGARAGAAPGRRLGTRHAVGARTGGGQRRRRRIEATPLDEFVEAFIEHDPGRALTVVAHAVQQGRDPRTLTEELVAPPARLLPVADGARAGAAAGAARSRGVADQAQRLGAAAIVRAMERLGEMLVEMRHAPDPRVLLEVALVQLTHDAAGADLRPAVAARAARAARWPPGRRRGAVGRAAGARRSVDAAGPRSAAAPAATPRPSRGGARRQPPPHDAPSQPHPPQPTPAAPAALDTGRLRLADDGQRPSSQVSSTDGPCPALQRHDPGDLRRLTLVGAERDGTWSSLRRTSRIAAVPSSTAARSTRRIVERGRRAGRGRARWSTAWSIAPSRRTAPPTPRRRPSCRLNRAPVDRRRRPTTRRRLSTISSTRRPSPSKSPIDRLDRRPSPAPSRSRSAT